MTRRTWTAEGDPNTVAACSERSARRKLEALAGYAVGRVYIDEESEAYAELPDCDCGWRGRGSGPAGQFRRGDRCPACGAWLD